MTVAEWGWGSQCGHQLERSWDQGPGWYSEPRRTPALEVRAPRGLQSREAAEDKEASISAGEQHPETQKVSDQIVNGEGLNISESWLLEFNTQQNAHQKPPGKLCSNPKPCERASLEPTLETSRALDGLNPPGGPPPASWKGCIYKDQVLVKGGLTEGKHGINSPVTLNTNLTHSPLDIYLSHEGHVYV